MSNQDNLLAPLANNHLQLVHLRIEPSKGFVSLELGELWAAGEFIISLSPKGAVFR